jgi:molybdopterin/thiamine biosynthesis adenylyltransferase
MACEVAGIFKDDLRDKILASKLLVVGAGGIGCEILKNLVMCGFKDIEIVSFMIYCINLIPSWKRSAGLTNV